MLKALGALRLLRHFRLGKESKLEAALPDFVRAERKKARHPAKPLYANLPAYYKAERAAERLLAALSKRSF